MKGQSFFRQLGWVFVATMVGALCNSSVHFFARLIKVGEWGLFTTFVQSFLPLLSIPALGLQTAFAHLSASSVDPAQERDLSAAIRRVTVVLTGLWIVAVVFGCVFSTQLLQVYKLGSFQRLVILFGTVLGTLLLPVFSGVIQGRQDFLWFGWITILGGLGRLAGVAIMMALFGATPTNAMVGVFIGQSAAVAVAVWRSRRIWSVDPGRFDLGNFIRRIAPLTIALGAITILQTADMTAAQQYLTKAENGLYGAAAGIARSVFYLSAPMIYVMFPRIVRDAATSAKSSVLAQACGLSLLVCSMAAIAATILPELPFRIVQGPDYLGAAAFLPSIAWSFLPLMLTTVLLNNLLARSRYSVIGPLALLAIAYWIALRFFKDTPHHIIATLGIFATAALLMMILFTWIESRKKSV